MSKRRALSASPNVATTEWADVGMIFVGAIVGGAVGSVFGSSHCAGNTTDPLCQDSGRDGWYSFLGTVAGIGAAHYWSR